MSLQMILWSGPVWHRKSHCLSIKVAVKSNFHACVYGLNFWTGLYDILGSITSSKDTLEGSKSLQFNMIRSWNISWEKSSVVNTDVAKTASNISKVTFLLITM